MGIAEEVMIFLDVKGIPDLKQVEKGMMKLGYNLRLAGRDLMRMGGSLEKLGKWMSGFAMSVFQGSDLIKDALDDVKWALEDIFEATGIMEFFVEALEKLATFIEDNPWIAWGLTILAVAGIITIIIGKIMGIIGFVRLLVGSFLSARTSGLSWSDSLRVSIAMLTGHNISLKEAIALEIQAKMSAEQLTAAKKAETAAIVQAGTAMQTSMGPFLEARQTKLPEFPKQKVKPGKQAKGFKKLEGGIGKAVLGLGIFLLLLPALQPIFEAMSPILEAIGGAVEVIIEPFEDWIYTIADLIEEHPELVGGIIALFGALMAFNKVSEIVGTMKSLGDWIKHMPEHITKLKEHFLRLKDRITGLGTKIWDFAKNAGAKLSKFFTDLVTNIGTKVAPAIGFLKAHFVALGIGIMAAIGMFILVDQLLNLLPAQLRGPVGAIMALIGAIVAATVAWLAFHGTMTVGVAVPIILAAVGAGIAGIKAMVSMEDLARPVEIGEPTVALLHPGEEVHPRRGPGGYIAKEPPLAVTVDITGAGSIKEIIQRSVEASVAQISERMERKYRMKEY